MLRYDEVPGKERVFLVQLKDTKDGTIYLRAKTPAESADWLKSIKASVSYHQSIFIDPTLPEVLLILSCKREPSNPISFTFQQFGSQDRVYMTMLGAILYVRADEPFWLTWRTVSSCCCKTASRSKSKNCFHLRIRRTSQATRCSTT